MLQKVTRLDSVPTAEETVLTTEVPTKESRLYTLLWKWGHNGQCKRTGSCYNELVVAFFSTGGGLKGKKNLYLLNL